MRAVVRVGVEVVAGGGALRRQRRGLLDRRARLQRPLGGGGSQRGAAHGGERDPAVVDGDADDGPVVGPPDELLVPPAHRSAARHPDRGEQFVGLERRLERPDEEVVNAHHAHARRPADLDRAAEREQRHRQVGGRVRVRERAADGAAVPDLGVADLRGRVGQDRRLRLQQRRSGDLGVPRRRADDHLVALEPDARQLRHPGDVDQHGRLGEPDLHHRQQRVAARQQLGVLAVLGQERDRVRGGVGDLVVERRGDHASTSVAPFGAEPAEEPGPESLSAAARTERTMLW